MNDASEMILIACCCVGLWVPGLLAEERTTGAVRSRTESKVADTLVVEAPQADKPKEPAAKGPAAKADVGVLADPVVGPLREKFAIKIVAPPPAAPVAVNMQNQAVFEQSFRRQLQPFLKAELNFVRLICDVPMEKRSNIRDAGTGVVKEIARVMAVRQLQPQAAGGSSDDFSQKPRTAIRSALEGALQSVLTADEMKEFRKEAAHRLAYRKQAATQLLVVRLDNFLRLSAEQREKIAAGIDSEWQEKWEQWLSLANYRGEYMPQIPNSAVTPHLTPEQNSVWSTIGRVDFGFRENGFVERDDGWWGVEEEDPLAPGFVIGF